MNRETEPNTKQYALRSLYWQKMKKKLRKQIKTTNETNWQTKSGKKNNFWKAAKFYITKIKETTKKYRW